MSVTLNTQLLEALAAKPATALELAQSTGVPMTKLKNALQRMRIKGLLNGPGRGNTTGQWRIVDASEAQPEARAPISPAIERKRTPNGGEWSMRAKVGEAEIDVHGSPDFVRASTEKFFATIVFMYGDS